MKTVNFTLYSFDELSKEVQKEIIDRERWNIMDQCMESYGSEYRQFLRAFERITKTNVHTWDVDYSSYHFDFKHECNEIYKSPVDYTENIYQEDLCGKLLFRYINKQIIPQIAKGKYYSTPGKWIEGKYHYTSKHSRISIEYDNCPLTGTCYDYFLLHSIIEYYNSWCKYPANYSLKDLINDCYKQFFRTWHEEYEYWADNEEAIREELHNSQYEKQMYYKNGKQYDCPLRTIV